MSADTAKLIKREVSDGVIAPGYTVKRGDFKSKEKGRIQCYPDRSLLYRPAEIERKQVFGVTFEQGRK